MKVVIVEDELPAAAKLQKMLEESGRDIEIVRVLTSINESLNWFEANGFPDLLFMDIELGDGLSLTLIDKARINCPIIFITAFDDYWQEAFEHNSIDYLLKPLRKERLESALNKFEGLQNYFTTRYTNLLNYQKEQKKYRDRFLVKRGREYASIKSVDIAFFYATHKLVCLVDKGGGKFILDHSLAEIERQVDPANFFRVNRKYLVHMEAIQKITSLPKSKLLIEVNPKCADELIISGENNHQFKTWIGK